MSISKTEQPFESAEAAGDRTAEPRETYDDRLNHILQAATGLFAREGYQRASMREVAKVSGTSLAGLYHYFDSKEKMLFLIQFRSFNSLLSNLREKLHGIEDPLEQLRTLIKSHITFFACNMEALKVCSHELESLTGSTYEELRSIRHEYYLLARDIVARVADLRAHKNGFDVHHATMFLFGTLNWLYRWYDPKKGRSPNVLANQITDQFLGGVLGQMTPTNGEHVSDSPPDTPPS